MQKSNKLSIKKKLNVYSQRQKQKKNWEKYKKNKKLEKCSSTLKKQK